MIQSMSLEMLQQEGCFFTENVKEAFDKYEAVIISAEDKVNLRNFLQKVCENNQGKMYADFYYSTLNREQKEGFVAGLSEAEKNMLSRFETENGQVYYPVGSEEVDFLFEITARNWLFSTFYGANKKVMIWGNYDLEFPLFCEDKETLEFYKCLARECELECKV